MELLPAMNNTKWEELRMAMYKLGDLSPMWRTKCTENGYVTRWDGEWFYHLSEGGYTDIEWLEIKVSSSEQNVAVYRELNRIHVPGERVESGFRVYGYLPHNATVDYL